MLSKSILELYWEMVQRMCLFNRFKALWNGPWNGGIATWRKIDVERRECGCWEAVAVVTQAEDARAPENILFCTPETSLRNLINLTYPFPPRAVLHLTVNQATGWQLLCRDNAILWMIQYNGITASTAVNCVSYRVCCNKKLGNMWTFLCSDSDSDTSIKIGIGVSTQ